MSVWEMNAVRTALINAWSIFDRPVFFPLQDGLEDVYLNDQKKKKYI